MTSEEISHEKIKDILKAAVYAPSGSNSQPWHFEVHGNEIAVLAEPEKDHPILNYRNRGTWLAEGALIENIVIAATHHGLRAAVGPLFPEKNNPNCVAHIALEAGAVPADPLFSAIKRRASNRKPYRVAPLTGPQKEILLAQTHGAGDVSVTFVEDRHEIDDLAQAVSMNEIVMLEDRKLHDLFFDELVWTEAEEHQKKSGLYVKTMELAPPKEGALKLFKHWALMRVANFLGVAKKIAAENAVAYAACAGMLVLSCSDTDETFIHAGRTMQRLWLTAVSLGLSGHLISGIFFLHQRLKEDASLFSPRHASLINTAYDTIQQKAHIAERNIIALVLRVGVGGEPSATSSRKEPDITFT